jgi:hypothetical protein
MPRLGAEPGRAEGAGGDWPRLTPPPRPSPVSPRASARPFASCGWAGGGGLPAPGLVSPSCSGLACWLAVGPRNQGRGRGSSGPGTRVPRDAATDCGDAGRGGRNDQQVRAARQVGRCSPPVSRGLGRAGLGHGGLTRGGAAFPSPRPLTLSPSRPGLPWPGPARRAAAG